MKRIAAPKAWMLDKLGGCFAPKPAPGPHKQRECLPLILILRNRLKYALNYKEVMSILMQRHIKVDGKVKTEKCYPAGLMDTIDIDSTDEHFRVLLDTKGRFTLHRISAQEAGYKLCRVVSAKVGDRAIPVIGTHDGRTIRYPDPITKVNDTVKLDLETGKITEVLKFDVGQMGLVIGGRNAGRVGLITSREKHKGSFDIVHMKDSAGNKFATRLNNVMIVGNANKPAVSLPKGKGVKLSIVEEQKRLYTALGHNMIGA
mmetsp:Transcript_9108/g.33425  ORF Transcript_9108/g.33425 Transcript_9108/m.33425 type:complete len:259 (+) Transcript_9108:380-1156(+)